MKIPKQDKNLSNAHDQFFRTAMADKRVATQFLKAHLPKDLCQQIDYDWQIDKQGGGDYLAIVLQYLLERGELSDKDAFFNLIDTQISHQVGEKIMSLAEQLRQEGKLEGKLEGIREGELKGKLEIAERMLAAGSDPVFIEKVTALSIDQIKKLAKNCD